MLTKRQEEILKLIVIEYIKLAKPVGSKLICDELNCSSATIRNEMQLLEEMGLLEKTHTSSGRIPSEKGYRYYVDNLMELKELNGEEVFKLQTVFNNTQLELSDVLSKSLELISDMTSYTSIMLDTKSHENKLKEISIVPVSETVLVVIVVTDQGYVEHKNIELVDVSLEEVKKTVKLINDLIVGTPIDEVSSKLEFEIKPVIGRYVKQHEMLYNAFYDVFTDISSKNVNVVGKNNILKHYSLRFAAVPRTPYKPQKYVLIKCDFHIDGERLGTPVVGQAQTFALGNAYMPSVPYMFFKQG